MPIKLLLLFRILNDCFVDEWSDLSHKLASRSPIPTSCWLILKRITLFGRGEEDCAKYKDIGMKIVDKCKGLPLAVKTLGSMLRCKNDLMEWENVLGSEIWELEEAQVDIFPHLLLSYNELSPTLKRCFSYCAVFPKDSEIVVEEVIRKWMALGYLGSDIGSDCGGDMELRGRQYFDNLAMRSLFEDFTKYDSSDRGKIKYFKLHDIVHDFAQFLRKNDTVGVEAGTYKRTSCQACSHKLVSQVKEYRSLFLNYEDPCVCNCLNSLRVLGLINYSGIPQGIEKFIHLRWLNLSFNSDLPLREGLETICDELYNLQTLSLRSCKLVEIPRGIGNLINLRHLDLSTNGSLKGLPMEIGNLINLRHLDLSDNYSLKELPREIGNLIHLRHLKLCDNKSLRELPENICDMRELETLDVDYCSRLSKLPQGIHRLVNLEHLHNNGTSSLMQFPKGIGQLTRLCRLSEFRVGKDMGKLGWLKNLNRLGGSLSLRISLTAGSENTNVEDSRNGELRNKEHLHELNIWFDDEMDIEVEDCVWMDVIDALQPHPNLKSLTIDYFKGSRLPSWIASPLNQVKQIRLNNFSRLSSILLPLGNLSCLEEMLIYRMPKLQFVGREFLRGITTGTIVYPKLILSFQDCPNWKEWEDITAQEEEDDEFISLVPRLTELNITMCNILVALPHQLLCKVATSLNISHSTQQEQRYGDKEGSHINPRI